MINIASFYLKEALVFSFGENVHQLSMKSCIKKKYSVLKRRAGGSNIKIFLIHLCRDGSIRPRTQIITATPPKDSSAVSAPQAQKQRFFSN